MKNMDTDSLLSWLLEENNPSVRYFTLRFLLDKKEDDAEVVRARSDILESKPVLEILNGQSEEGYWHNPQRYMKRYEGTFWHFILLLELGVDPKDPRVQKTAQYLLETAYSFNKHGFVNEIESDPVPCYNSYFLWAMLRCGFYDKTQVQDCIQGIIDTMQFNDGDAQVNTPDHGCIGKHTCIRGAVPVLRAFVELAKTDDSPAVQRIIAEGQEFLLIHHLYKRSHALNKTINPRLTRLTFPNFYYPDFLQMLELLLDSGCKDERMCDAYAALLKKQKEDGKWELERVCNERGKDDLFPVPIVLEERNTKSKWVTLRALKVMKGYGDLFR